MTNKEFDLYDIRVGLGIATEAELDLVKRIEGRSWLEVLTNVLYIRTGYRDIDQVLEEMEGG